MMDTDKSEPKADNLPPPEPEPYHPIPDIFIDPLPSPDEEESEPDSPEEGCTDPEEEPED